MTTKETADRTAEAIDFTMMYVTHDAFRRDLGRFTAASAAGTAHAPGVRAGWENFKAQLLLHHSVEDTHLWPRVRRATAGRPAASPCSTRWRQNTPRSTRCSLPLTTPWPASQQPRRACRRARVRTGVAPQARRGRRAPSHPVGMHARGLARLRRRDAPPPGHQRRGYLRPVDPRRQCTRRAAAVPGCTARSGPSDQPPPVGAALPPAGPVEGLTAPGSACPRWPGSQTLQPNRTAMSSQH